jgi:SAM-dependent methyltransferase
LVDKSNWFASWFDSPYYHLLYDNRDHSEAEMFIGSLFEHLQLEKGKRVLDLACGQGRHALQVNQLGYTVVGVDLSLESIKEASNTMTSDSLTFERKDMRELHFDAEFDLVMNLFTSFGYFQKEGDNQKVLSSVSDALRSGGILVLDYLNIHKVTPGLPLKERIRKGGIDFHISKELHDNFIVKTIEFEADEERFLFKEYVKRIDLDLFRTYLSNAGFHLEEVFGSYELEPFNETTSDRLLLIAKKK